MNLIVCGIEQTQRHRIVRLISPSGKIWEWNEPQDNNKITGLAEEFSQVVTHCRNIKDTNLKCYGHTAST